MPTSSASNPTPGQVAYAAWYTLHTTGWRYEGPLPWSQLEGRTKDVWEAIAQAVLAWQKEHPHA